MREADYQAVLFETTEPKPTHLHYGTWSSAPEVKVGMTAVGVERRMKRDGQFKGHSVVFQRPAPIDCEVHIEYGKKKCDWERNWERAHAHDRIPGTEKYRITEDIVTAMGFMVGTDAKGRAALEWIRRYGLGQTA
jgi:hypothetical protein